MKRAGLPKAKFLATALLVIASEVFFIPTASLAATAGSGVCQQTYTVSSGTADVLVTESGGYCYIAFKNTGALNSQSVISWSRPSLVTSADVLVVGGGGGGGARHGGGGGAGGFVQSDGFAISSASTIAIAVGGGGSGGSSSNYAGTSGQNSYFKPSTGSASGLIALGGGFGSSGGSGGGGSSGGAGSGQTVASIASQTQSTFAGVTLNGISFGSIGAAGASDTNVGGDSNDYWAGGGGGGAASAGALPTSAGTTVTSFANYTSSTARGGNGGGGKSVAWISPSIATTLTVGQSSSGSVFFAGGGGGGIGVDGVAGGAGGLGGGAAGSRTESSGNAGTAFTGGGGGGSGYDDINKAGSTETVGAAPAGAGGSGIVILRYVIPDTTAPTITGPSSATGATSSISIPETATAVFTFSANETVSWSKSGIDGSFFTISTGGALTVTARDHESPADSDSNNSYIVVITATDSANNATSQTVTVNITNINEAPSITINSSLPTHSISQGENSSSVIIYTGTDVEAGTSLSWSLSGTDASDFSINSGTGSLSFAANPDYEAPADSDGNNSYIVIVTLSDGALTDSQTLTITITDTNEVSALGAPSVSGAVYKGVTKQITVTSNAAGRIRFYVSGKRISNCLAVSTTGSGSSYTATCSWKPAVHGRQILTASITPVLNSFTGSTSAQSEVFILKRSGNRS
jgi:hypothetical protein